MSLSVMIYMEIHALPPISGLVFLSILGKVVNGPGSHTALEQRKINISPACIPPADSAAGEGDL